VINGLNGNPFGMVHKAPLAQDLYCTKSFLERFDSFISVRNSKSSLVVHKSEFPALLYPAKPFRLFKDLLKRFRRGKLAAHNAPVHVDLPGTTIRGRFLQHVASQP